MNKFCLNTYIRDRHSLLSFVFLYAAISSFADEPTAWTSLSLKLFGDGFIQEPSPVLLVGMWCVGTVEI